MEISRGDDTDSQVSANLPGKASATGGPRSLSIVAPMHNEENLVREFVNRVISMATPLGLDFELIIVDDGSTDGTSEALREIGQSCSELVIVSLYRNFGHQAALLAGIAESSGDLVVTMDGDLQDPPEVVPRLLSELTIRRAEVVVARRTERPGESMFKKATAKIFYHVFNLLSDVKIPSDTGDFRIMNREVADILLSSPGHPKFLRGLLPWVVGQQFEIQYVREERLSGVTKFSLGRMVSLAVDGLIQFSLKPLEAATLLTVFSFAASIVAAVWAFFSFLSGQTIPGWASLMILVSFQFSLVTLILAIIALYLGRVWRGVLGRPGWLVRRVDRHPSKR